MGDSLTFKLYTDYNTVETFTLKDEEKFFELTMRFKKLVIIGSYSWVVFSKQGKSRPQECD